MKMIKKHFHLKIYIKRFVKYIPLIQILTTDLHLIVELLLEIIIKRYLMYAVYTNYSDFKRNYLTN